MNKFKERLKELRKERGMTRSQLAEELGISEPTISRWENGLRIPTMDSIILLCKYFKVTSDYLIGLSDF
ncbi:MAG: helix-turn-helix transcriptional regulator [Clostridia bacterium]|nr:helix-turn-helix transcriptional regulator [Clostridia bacterium]